ncbi:hypothetical protein [Pandoraea sp. PE-S2R-1]|uniref:hypothetical protein n=1 Tax=Pandoraea sp. PE-S2R-1 TaxID=1986994 RepID=UPI00148314C7|nr:hypothetical protein [Pandoraea sp. PE-S2R-1]
MIIAIMATTTTTTMITAMPTGRRTIMVLRPVVQGMTMVTITHMSTAMKRRRAATPILTATTTAKRMTPWRAVAIRRA